jgi:pyrroline-5-carboxylate reductase
MNDKHNQQTKDALPKTETFSVILIGGAGKVGLRLIQAILRYRKTYLDKKVIITVLRVRTEVRADMFADFVNIILRRLNVIISSDYSLLAKADLVFLGIPPKTEAAAALFQKVGTFLNQDDYVEKNKIIPIISYSSGFSLSAMKRVFRNDRTADIGLVSATLNINMDTGHGIIYASHQAKDTVAKEALKFLEPMAKIRKANAEMLPMYIAGVGSMLAYDIEYILRRYTEEGIQDRNLPDLLVSMQLKAEEWYGEERNEIEKWLNGKKKGYIECSIPDVEAQELSIATFVSAVRSLLDDFENKNPLIERRDSVPTKDGCTERQLKRQQECKSTNDMCEIIPDMISKTYEVALGMAIDVPVGMNS